MNSLFKALLIKFYDHVAYRLAMAFQSPVNICLKKLVILDLLQVITEGFRLLIRRFLRRHGLQFCNLYQENLYPWYLFCLIIIIETINYRTKYR